MNSSSISSHDGMMAVGETSIDREQRLKSAKKKLKSYRAKQAQMEQAKRQSMLVNNSSSSSGGMGTNSGSFSSSHSQPLHSSISFPAFQSSFDRSSVQSDRLMGSLINEAARESNQAIDNKRHSRTFSRSGGHGRGHSRTGSISLAASGLVVSAPQLSATLSNSLSNNASQNRLSTSASASSFIASTSHSHTRGHSRSHSRNGSRSLASGRSRPTSLIVAAKRESNSALKSDAWKDVEEKEDVNSNQIYDENDIDMLKTPTLASTSRLSNDQTPLADSSNVQRPIITATPATPIYNSNTQSNDATPIANPKRTSATHSRRPSRHSRKDSVSTRKESMEIMGGLGSLGINPSQISSAFDLPASNSSSSFASSYNQRQSRRISSQRWSGLQSASILFGGPSDGSGVASKRSSFDWRGAIASAEASEQANGGGGDDRLTALEKLEGRSKRHSRQSSVQLPSFDDVHGEQGMDKRASQDLIESNLKTTNSSGSILASIPFAAPPASPSANSNATLNGSTPAANGEMGVSVDSTAGGEVLGTLMEEEEEEEDIPAASSPLRERGGFDFPSNEEERKRRKQAEQEVIKRTRRTSLTPAPLKLSGRPASLFLSPRAPSSGQSSALTPSSSLPIFATMQQMSQQTESHDADVSQNSSSVEAEYAVSTPRARDAPSNLLPAATGISFSQSQRKLAEARLAGALPESSTRNANGPTIEMKRSWRASMPSAPGAMQQSLASIGTQTNSATGSTTNTPVKGMRALRLATNLNSSSRSDALQHHPNTESTSSFSSSASHSSSAHTGPSNSIAGTTSTPIKRGSFIYNPSMSNSEIGNTSHTSRRSSIQYRSSPLENNHAGDLSTSSISSSSSFGTTPATQTSINSITGSGVPLNMFEELKSKHQRDVALLDDARRTITRLEAELVSETQRTRREYDELERWSAEEKRSLGSRIEHLEASIVEITQVREAREEHHAAEIDQLSQTKNEIESQLEDAQAERDMLREDVEGWRTRCSDLEKNLRNERQSSPMINAASRDGSISPIITDFDAPPTPQAIKLLKDMRAQILTLARSLEHEKEQHAKTQQEKDQLSMRNARLIHGQSMENDETISSTITADTTTNSEIKSDFGSNYTLPAPPSSSSLNGNFAKSTTEGMIEASSSNGSLHNSSPSAIRRAYSYGSTGSNGSGSMKKKRNHVFAYDSSMESGMGSASMGSVSGTTHQTSEYLGSPGGGGENDHHHVYGKDTINNSSMVNEKDDEAFIAEVQADLVGLGMGSSLDTLAEEEELTPDRETISNSPMIESTNSEVTQPQQEVYTIQHRPNDSFDIEAGGPASDIQSTAPPTPALEHQSLPTMAIDARDDQNKFAHNSLSVASSSGSHVEPASPLPSQSQSSHDTITTPGRDSSENGRFTSQTIEGEDGYDDGQQYSDVEEEEENQLPPPPAPRPEFIREWSFSKALSAVQKSSSPTTASPNVKPKLRIGTQGLNVMSNGQRRRKATRKNVSIDDFFGIMNLDSDIKLPPLPTPEEALDMPPLRFENEQEMAISTSFNSSAANGYGITPRWPSTIRPPIAKTSRIYGQQSLSSRSSSTLSPSGSFNSYRGSSQSNRNGENGNDGYYGGGNGEDRIMSAPPVGAATQGGGMFSRVVSITSALSSGLGGYLLGGGGGATSPQSAPAFKNESLIQQYHTSENDYDERNTSISWAVTPRREVEEA